ncbi:hypothetical protein [Vreelandella aquamarina]|uniref:hypothetical protein n=1 Tax=Vreelandella aquamarina TaxID=77097 RepID=UPI00384E6F84
MKHSPMTLFTPPTAIFDLWKAGMMGMELWSSSLSTIAMRQQLWQTQPFFSPSMMRENQRMVTEKIEASIEAGLAMQKAMLSAMSGQYAPWWITSQKAMKPYHRRSSANSRRLSR